MCNLLKCDFICWNSWSFHWGHVPPKSFVFVFAKCLWVFIRLAFFFFFFSYLLEGISWLCRFSSIQSLSHVPLFMTPWTAAHQTSLSITNSRSLFKFMSIEAAIPSNHLILCCPLLLPPSIFPSIRVLSSDSVLHIRWPKYWSFSFSISPSNEYSGLISFRMDWLDLLAVQGTLKSLLQQDSSKASILRRSAFFIVTLMSIHDHWKNHSFD